MSNVNAPDIYDAATVHDDDAVVAEVVVDAGEAVGGEVRAVGGWRCTG